MATRRELPPGSLWSSSPARGCVLSQCSLCLLRGLVMPRQWPPDRPLLLGHKGLPDSLGFGGGCLGIGSMAGRRFGISPCELTLALLLDLPGWAGPLLPGTDLSLAHVGAELPEMCSFFSVVSLRLKPPPCVWACSLVHSLPLFSDSHSKSLVSWRWWLRRGHPSVAALAGILGTALKPRSRRAEGTLVSSWSCCVQPV